MLIELGFKAAPGCMVARKLNGKYEEQEIRDRCAYVHHNTCNRVLSQQNAGVQRDEDGCRYVIDAWCSGEESEESWAKSYANSAWI